MAVALFLFALFMWTSECTLGNAPCDTRYYQHYEVKGCSPVLGPDGCPVRFQCNPMTMDERKVCITKGGRYQVGETLKSAGPCDICKCSDDAPQDDAFISCAVIDCPDWVTNNKSCYMGYTTDSCCPKEICPSLEGGRGSSCNYKGKTYKVGQYVKVENPCKSCICTENWNGPEGPGCWDVDCLVGRNALELRSGCLPIYAETGCCARDIHCGGIYGSQPIKRVPENTENLCQHGGKYYDIGSKVFLEGDKYQCVSCTCSVPPDFTCLQKSCPPPPRPHCRAVYGHCCPEYTCP